LLLEACLDLVDLSAGRSRTRAVEKNVRVAVQGDLDRRHVDLSCG
jgi:hypothetical protein